MELARLFEGLDVRVVPSAVAGGGRDGWREVGAVRVCDVTEDSRTVVPGSLFIARGGTKSDGKLYVEQALAAGAVAILTDAEDPVFAALPVPVVVARDVALVSARIGERFYGDPSRSLALALVTGTNGKTTTTTLIWQMMNAAGRRCGLVGTVVVDDGTEVAEATMTTPPSIELSRTLQRMVEGGCVAGALEASSHALDQKRCDALAVRVGVFTNLSGDHLDYHQTMEAYASAKARLFELLPADAVAIVNADDPAHERMVRDCRARVVKCRLGAAGGADEAGVEIGEVSIEGMALTLTGPWGRIACEVPMVGRYNAMNVLEAVAASHALGLTGAELTPGLEGVRAPAGRLERVEVPGGKFHVFVDYAHSDDSLRKVLEAVGPLVPGREPRGGGLTRHAGRAEAGEPNGRLWVVFGCGGDKDRTKRPRMGRAAAELADLVVLTSDNPRSERPGAIIDEVLAGVPPALRAKVTVQVERERAIRHALEQARAGDVVVIAGKGHETEQVLSDGKGGLTRIHFDDREVARKILEERRATESAAAVKRRAGARAGAGLGKWGKGEG